MKKVLFIKNAAILTVTSLLLRVAGVFFKVWLAAAIGSEGIGLYQLIFSVYTLAATFATSGLCTAVTRLVSEELALGGKKSTGIILSRVLILSLVAAALSAGVLIFAAQPIAKFIIGDIRAVAALRILSLSLVFMGFSSCLRGYFIARRNAAPAGSSQILEQIVRISLVLFLIGRFSHLGLTYTCAAVFLGDTVAEGCSFLYLWLRYVFDRRKLQNSHRQRPDYPIVKTVLHIAGPITSGRYLGSLLRTAENMLVPRFLSQNPLCADSALSLFGMIKGMALPLLFFPSSLLNAFSTLLIPEISEARARGLNSSVRRAVEQILRITVLIGFLFGALFFVAGNEIGIVVYGSQEVGFLIKSLAPLVPLMYLDSLADGMLKGLDHQMSTFRHSVLDSSLRIVLVVLLLRPYGINGFLIIMYISNLMTCLLNVMKLVRETGAKIKFGHTVFIPLLSALISALFFGFLLHFLNVPNIFYVVFLCILALPAYFLLLNITKCFRFSEIREMF